LTIFNIELFLIVRVENETEKRNQLDTEDKASKGKERTPKTPKPIDKKAHATSNVWCQIEVRDSTWNTREQKAERESQKIILSKKN
jgi:hypothetical protein